MCLVDVAKAQDVLQHVVAVEHVLQQSLIAAYFQKNVDVNYDDRKG
jgi:hypothetical protein